MTDIVSPFVLTVEHEKNVHSQSGEDGIIARVLELIAVGSPRGTLVDIGAWDGMYLSNTAALRRLERRQTLLIEADPDRADLCLKLANAHAHVVCAKVSPDNVNMLLEAWPTIAIDGVDVLSVDIDGDDIWVFEALQCVRPKVVCIEYNPTYPPFLIRRNPLGSCKGSSLAAIEAVGKAKGYDLVYATISNAILVDTHVNQDRILVRDSFGAFRWDMCKFVVSDYDGANGLADIHGKLNEIVNPWDNIPAVTLHKYPQEMLGFNDPKNVMLRKQHVGEVK